MDKLDTDIDWNQVRAFLFSAESGSFSAAARALHTTQPTISRQVAALEQKLNLTLFERLGKTLVLTEAGLGLLDHIRPMGAAASEMALFATGQDENIEGSVSISASDAVSTYFLPPILKRLKSHAPGIRIELISSNDISDLKRREADIAVRHVRPQQPDLIAKLVRESITGLFSAKTLIDNLGMPQQASELAQLPFVGYDPLPRFIETLATIGVHLNTENFAYSTNSGVTMRELIRAGLGIGIMPTDFATAKTDLLPILPNLPPLPVETWLVTHRELRTNRRIRIVFDFLATEVAHWREAGN